MFLKNYKNLKKLSFYEFLILLFPFCILSGSFVTNLYLIFVSIFLIRNFYKKKETILIFKKAWVLIYILFILYNIINGIFSSDVYNALRSSIGQFRFLFFSLFIIILIKDILNLKYIIKIWFNVILLVSFDIYFQTIFLFNIIGMPMPDGGRASSFFGNEVVSGAFISYIFVPIIFFYISNFQSEKVSIKIAYILIYVFVFFAVILTGERLPLIILTGSSLLAVFYFFNFKQLLKISILFLIIFVGAYNFNFMFKSRMDNMLHVLSNVYNSSWGRIYESSFMLFKENYLSGVGLKNYRVECDLQEDPRPYHEAQFCSSHPHNFILELLSETGLLGLFIFTIFIFLVFFKLTKLIKLRENKNPIKNYALGNFLILLIYIWPIKTSGSFFSTFNGSFFWFSLGLSLLILSKIKDNKNKQKI